MVYNSKLNMTYLVITQQQNTHSEIILNLISKLWEKETTSEKLDLNPDIHILDGREINSIGIEEVKNLQEDMQFKPFQERVQIAIIIDAKKLTTQAQNAFLKTLEESSDSTAYILLVNNEKDLLPTIISRSKKVYAIENHDKTEGKDIKEFCFELKNLIEAFSKIESLSKDKIKSIEYLEQYLLTLQKILRQSIKEGRNSSEIAQKISLVNITKGQILANGNRRLLFENLYLQIQRLG